MLFPFYSFFLFFILLIYFFSGAFDTMRYSFTAYRNQSYPNATRKPILSSMKRKDSKESYSATQSFETSSPASTTTGTPITSPQKSLSIREESHEEAILSERAGHSEPHSDSDSEERRVQFNRAKFQIEPTGENIIEEMEMIDDDEENKEKKKHKGYYDTQYTFFNGIIKYNFQLLHEYTFSLFYLSFSILLIFLLTICY